MNDMLTLPQIAKRLGVEDITVRKYREKGYFPNAQKVGQMWLVPLADVEAFTPPANGYPAGKPRTPKKS